MAKFLTRFASVSATIALLALSACNPVKKNANTGTAGTTPPPAGKTATAPTGGTVKLGFNLEMTGDAATFGQSAKAGADMAIDEVNNKGGVNNMKLAAVYDDNASDSQQAVSVASKLISQDKVDVLIGCVASSNSLAAGKVAEESKVPMVTPASTKPSVTVGDDGKVKRYIYRTCFTDDFQGAGMVDFIVNGELHGKKAVLFYDADNDYSKGIYETVKKVAPDKGLTIVAEDSYLGKSETDFRSHLSRFKGQTFDVLIVPGYYGQVSQIANQARELGLKQPLVGGDGWDSAELWKVGGKNIEGSYFTNHYSAQDKDPHVQDFIRKYKERNGGNVPDAMAILTYDTVLVVADAIARAGSADKEKVTDALADTKNFEGASGTITINATHDATKKLVVLKVGAGGKYDWVYTFDPNAAGTGGKGEEKKPAESGPSNT